MSMPRMFDGVLAALVGVGGELDAAGLAPAADLDLGLDHDRVADPVGGGDGVVDGGDRLARRRPGCRTGRRTACLGTRTGSSAGEPSCAARLGPEAGLAATLGRCPSPRRTPAAPLLVGLAALVFAVGLLAVVLVANGTGDGSGGGQLRLRRRRGAGPPPGARRRPGAVPRPRRRPPADLRVARGRRPRGGLGRLRRPGRRRAARARPRATSVLRAADGTEYPFTGEGLPAVRGRGASTAAWSIELLEPTTRPTDVDYDVEAARPARACLHLVGAGAGQLVDGEPALGHLVVGEALGGEGLQRVGVERRRRRAAGRRRRAPRPCGRRGAATTAASSTSGCSSMARSTSRAYTE